MNFCCLKMTLRNTILPPLVFALAAVGCVSTIEPAKRGGIADAIRRAEVYAERGEYRRAATIFQQIANGSKSPNRERFQMQSAFALANSGDNVSAKRVADSINPINLSLVDRSRLYLLLGNLAIDAGKPQQALGYLNKITVDNLKGQSKLSYHQSRAAAHSILGNLLDSVRERVKASEYLTDPDTIEKYQLAIMEALFLVPEETLVSLQPRSPSTLGGWMALARILKRYGSDPREKSRRLTHWQLDFPDHPATENFIQDFVDHQYREFEVPKKIAVLLPESGPYMTAAETIRQGISVAFFQQDDTFAPDIRFFDTQGSDVYDVYQQAVSQGADFVIGPLIKENLSSLLKGRKFPVPVLALNRIEDPVNHQYFVEFGLSPEDETEQAASNAWFDGHQNALVVTPATNFGRRLGAHFAEYWQNLGGKVLEVQSYDPKGSDFSLPIKQLLDLDQSEQRFNQIKRIAPGMKFDPRRRHDVDFIFLVAQPREARLIRPQLQFYRASRIPVYATSHVYSGHPNPSMDQDLSDITFCDIRWLLKNESTDNPLVQSLMPLREDTPASYVRLIALGVDAYNIIPHLNRLRRDSAARYDGLTGILSIEQNNQVRRQLHCAQFDDGLPQYRGLAPHLRTGRESERSGLFPEEPAIGGFGP